MKSHIDVHCQWYIKERIDGLWVVVREFHNVLTTYGLNALATAPSGNYLAPTYLVLDTANTTLSNTYPPGTSSIQTAGDPTVGGDTQLDLSIGMAGQETVTFTNKTGSGPYTWTLQSPTVNAHTLGDFVVRTPTAGDTMAAVLSEGQYDPTYFANKRAPITSYYAPGTGQATMQYFISGIEMTNMYVSHVGLADSITIGQGNLHNYASIGYNHNNTNDTEFDAIYTLTGS